MTRTHKETLLKEFRERKVEKSLIEEARKQKSQKTPFELLSLKCFFEIRDEEEEDEEGGFSFVEKFYVGFETDFADFSLGFPTEKGIDILVGLFYAISKFYEMMSDFLEGKEKKEWLLSRERAWIVSDLFALRDFLVKEKTIIIKKENKTEILYHQNGTYSSKIEFFNNDKEAYERNFFYDETDMSEMLYVGGKKTGVSKWFRENGKMHYEICYEDDKELWREEYDENGKNILGG